MCRCDGNYTFCLHQPNFPAEKFKDSKKEHVRFGFLTADHLDADKFDYAKQASERIVNLQLCNSSGTSVKIEADMLWSSLSLRKKGVEMIFLGIDEINVAKIAKLYPAVKKVNRNFDNVAVTFVLKYSYFDRLHRAIDQLPEEVLKKIIPDSEFDFTHPADINSDFKKKSYMIPCIQEFVVLDKKEKQLFPNPQMLALRKIITSDSSKAPVVVVGSFGTGKTRVLARAAYQILFNNRQAKVLVCAHHQASADSLVENYFGRMIDSGWKCRNLIRLIPPSYLHQVKFLEYQKYYMTIGKLHKLNKKSISLVVTTFSTSLHLSEYLGKNHFTHILLDEGAQTREPETIAPLCLANKNTKIVIVGDHKQVRCILIVYKIMEGILRMKCCAFLFV